MPTPAGPADWVSYSGVLARTGANFDVAGTILIPEPGTFLMAALGLAGLVAFERRTCRSC